MSILRNCTRSNMQIFRDTINPAVLTQPFQENLHRKVQETSHNNLEHQVIRETPVHSTQYVGNFCANLIIWNN